MKNFAKFLGAMRSIAIIALVAVIGFSFAACDDGNGGGGGFVAVTNITGVPTTATVGTALTLTGTGTFYGNQQDHCLVGSQRYGYY